MTVEEAAAVLREHKEAERKKKNKSPADALIEAAVAAKVEVFRGSDGDLWASLPRLDGGGRDLHRIDDVAFSDWLTLFAIRSGLPSPARTVVQTACGVFRAKARQSDDVRDVFIRVAEFNGRTYLDLGDRDGTVVEIDATGWRVVTDCPARFYRPRNTLPLPVPVREGADHDLLWKYLNFPAGRDRDLVLAWVLGAWRTRGALTGLLVAGETHLLAFDNVNRIEARLESLLCQIATGGTLSSRELYENKAVSSTTFKRPMLLNTARPIVPSEELRDRLLTVTVSPIWEGTHCELDPLDAAFAADLPRILGGLLNLYAAALAGRDAVGPPLPRNADFGQFGEAALRDLGRPPGTLNRWVKEQAFDAVLDDEDNLSLVLGLSEIAEAGFEGTATSLLAKLKALPGIDADELPADAASLGKELSRLQQKASALGLRLDKSRGSLRRTYTLSLVRRPATDPAQVAATAAAEPEPATTPAAEPASDPSPAA